MPVIIACMREQREHVHDSVQRTSKHGLNTLPPPPTPPPLRDLIVCTPYECATIRSASPASQIRSTLPRPPQSVCSHARTHARIIDWLGTSAPLLLCCTIHSSFMYRRTITQQNFCPNNCRLPLRHCRNWLVHLLSAPRHQSTYVYRMYNSKHT